jgi:alkylation response protein AidB-like acyl-CoA dehydrogenase
MRPELDALAPTPEEAEVVAALVAALRGTLRGHPTGLAVDAAHGIEPGTLHALRELGLFGASLPESHGGAGLSLHATGSLMTALARIDRSIATTLGLHLGLGTRGLVSLGTLEQQDRWLAELAGGRLIAAFAATEAGAGSDLAAVRTTARRTNDTYHVSGEKIFVTNGGFAGIYTILAASPGLGGRRGCSLFLVSPDDPGVRHGPEEQKLGIRGSSTTTLYLDEASLPADRLLGEPGHGLDHASAILAWGRTLMAFGCTGTAQAALERAVDQVRQRRQFGRSLVEMPVVRAQLAEMAADVFAMEALVRWAASDGALLGTRSLTAKVYCSERSWAATDRCVQLFGGSGFIEETGIPLLLRDARIPRIFEGANDVLLVHLGLLEAAQPRATHSTLGLRVADLRRALVDRHGVHLARQPLALHRLGHAVVLRDALEAVGGRSPSALAAHAVALIEARAEGLLGGDDLDHSALAAAEGLLT